MQQPETKISMNQGAAYWASITGAPRPHRSTLIRWAIKGVRGKRLRAEPLRLEAQRIDAGLRLFTYRCGFPAYARQSCSWR